MIRVYRDRDDWWVGYYRGEHAHFVCPLPTLVIRVPRGSASTRCPAPVRTTGGVMSCVLRRDACTEPSHRRWDRVAPLLELVWRIKPWWPNRLGRAQDRGRAHVCPTIQPCRACAAGIPR